MTFDQHLRDGFVFGRYLVWEYDLVKYVEGPEQSRSGRFRCVMVSMVNAGADHPADGVVCDSLRRTGESWFGHQRAGFPYPQFASADS
jgi:hypothetical protein